MIPHSMLMRESMSYSRAVFSEMDIVYDGELIAANVALSKGSVSTDRGSNTRYSAKADVALHNWEKLPLNSNGTLVRLRYGLTSLGIRESVQLGEYQVFDFGRTNRGLLSLTLKGMENFVIEAKFIRPRTPPLGASTLTTIQNLILEVLPDAEFVDLASTDRPINATGAWERERWDAVTALTDSINAEVFCGYDGRWYIVDKPDLLQLVGQYDIAGGPHGVMISEARSNSRDKVYNAVSVSTQSSDAAVPPLWAWAYDANPASPTYYYGPNGERPRFYSSQFFTTVPQCQAYADRLLAESLAPNRTLSIGATPIPFLEAGDTIRVTSVQDEPIEHFLIQSTGLNLGTGGWSAETLSRSDAYADAA